MSGWPNDDDAMFDASAALGGTNRQPDHPEPDSEVAGDPVADDSGSVRVWVDQDGRLVKVQVSNRWRERAKIPLAERFRQAIGRAQQARVEIRPMPHSDLPGREPGAEMPLDTIVRRLLELSERRRELKQRPDGEVRRSSWTGTAGVGRSNDHKVEVALDSSQRTERVTIDEDWVRGARAEQITEAVLEAHRAAYAAHVPGEFTIGEFGELSREAAALANELMPRVTH